MSAEVSYNLLSPPDYLYTTGFVVTNSDYTTLNPISSTTDILSENLAFIEYYNLDFSCAYYKRPVTVDHPYATELVIENF